MDTICKRVLILVLLGASAYAQQTGLLKSGIATDGTWQDGVSCSEALGVWSCKGDWYQGSYVAYTLTTSDFAFYLSSPANARRCEDGNIDFTSRKDKITTVCAGKKVTFKIVRAIRRNYEDDGMKKARIELCQQHVISGDRCADVPSRKTP